MEPMHLHGSMDVPAQVAPVYEMTKRKHMTAILDLINCQLSDCEYRNLSPYWTVNDALLLHKAQHDREAATVAFLDKYWETVRRSYTDLGVLCMPPFSVPLDFQLLADETMRWFPSTFPPRKQTFPPVLITFDGAGFHEYTLAHAEVNGQPFPNYGARDEGQNTLVFALADGQFIPRRSVPSSTPQPISRYHRRLQARIPSMLMSRATPSQLVPTPSTPPQPDNTHPLPPSGPTPFLNPLDAALAAAKNLSQYSEAEPFRQQLKIFIDLLTETRASPTRTRAALSSQKFLKRLQKFMRWYEDLEGERILGKRLLFKLEDEPRLRDFFTKLTHIRGTETVERTRPPSTSRATLDLERVEQTLNAFQELVERMADRTNDPSVDV